ncbi:hypothetical protein OG21DRAFT_947729 [Imleria badia]|nr:hypothetical protein OG21DRAFT_947729 [Imleria badia]
MTSTTMSLTRPKRNPLYVVDIFHVILDCLSEPYPDSDYDDLVELRTPREDGRRALAALAQTCHMFSEPSLNCLWRKLASFRPLLRCLFPADIVDAGPEGENLRPPSLAQWSIIYRYSHRIHELQVCDDGHLFFLEYSVFEPNLLPNLRVLIWNPVDLSIAFMRPLLGPKLVSFKLDLNIEPGDHKELTSLLKTLPSHCPELQSARLAIFPNGHDGEIISPILSQVVCGFKKLDFLDVHAAIDRVAMRHLIISPQFAQLFITIQQSQVKELSLLPSDTPFSGAKKIGLFGLDLGSITGLLRSEGQMFSSTEFHLGVPPTSQLTLSFLTMLASHPRRSSLQSINLYGGDSYTTHSELEDLQYILSHDTLKPLIFLRNLRELKIDLSNPISLDDEELVNLARGWPLLHTLQLVSNNGASAKHLTLQGLLFLVVICPNLESVDLCLDAGQVPTSGVGMDVRNATVKELNFPRSPINDPRLVADFLLKHFPSVQGDHVECTEKWERVWQYLKEYKSSLQNST